MTIKQSAAAFAAEDHAYDGAYDDVDFVHSSTRAEITANGGLSYLQFVCNHRAQDRDIPQPPINRDFAVSGGLFALLPDHLKDIVGLQAGAWTPPVQERGQWGDIFITAIITANGIYEIQTPESARNIQAKLESGEINLSDKVSPDDHEEFRRYARQRCQDLLS